MPHSKKVLAIAVAGALSVPAGLALAQTSTVQIGGGMNLLYYMTDPNNSSIAKKGDVLAQSEPELRVRGEEKLGGGLSAWFQCATSMDGMAGGTGATVAGLCTRNSAVGMKGNFGNVFFGNWDLPAKLTINQVRGWFSGTNALWGGSARLLESGSSSGAPNPSGLTSSGSSSFYRRQAESVSYHSPRFGGFQFLAAYSSTNATAAIPETNPLKPRLYSLAGHYTSGPLWLGLSYENHKDYNPASQALGAGASAYNGGTDHAWTIGARYTFAGVFRLSGRYTQADYDTTNVGNLRSKGWSIHADWKVQGPHSLKAQYASQSDPSGNTSACVGRYVGNLSAPALAGLSRGATHYTLAYTYDFSKRTRGVLAYNHISNDAGSAQSLGTTQVTVGGAQKHYGFGLQHRF